MKIKAYCLSFLFLLSTLTALADAAPAEMLKQVSNQMLSELNKNQGNINKQVVGGIINRVLLPHVDLETMSRSVVGREYWAKATPAEREEFKRAFTNLVIKVYAAPLSTFNGETIEFKPMRDSAAARPQVESVVLRKSGQRIPVSYRLVQSGGAWKVYDFSVEGISMISSYRSQFDSILQQKGLAGLMNRLKAQ
ncbi:MAG: ABC transporter substrate-binding protein [Gammaproteobacteria bacterium]|nr:ABC transporter substrate-binding protein [Gammaproteobacteria bacterium]